MLMLHSHCPLEPYLASKLKLAGVSQRMKLVTPVDVLHAVMMLLNITPMMLLKASVLSIMSVHQLPHVVLEQNVSLPLKLVPKHAFLEMLSHANVKMDTRTQLSALMMLPPVQTKTNVQLT